MEVGANDIQRIHEHLGTTPRRPDRRTRDLWRIQPPSWLAHTNDPLWAQYEHQWELVETGQVMIGAMLQIVSRGMDPSGPRWFAASILLSRSRGAVDGARMAQDLAKTLIELDYEDFDGDYFESDLEVMRRIMDPMDGATGLLVPAALAGDEEIEHMTVAIHDNEFFPPTHPGAPIPLLAWDAPGSAVRGIPLSI
jgi:hypothetical protein